MKQRVKVFRIFIENQPCQYIVTNRAWKGKVFGRFHTEYHAEQYARALNLHFGKAERR